MRPFAPENPPPENMSSEIRNTLLKPPVHKKLFIKKGRENELVELVRKKVFIITKERYETDKVKKDHTDNKFFLCPGGEGGLYRFRG